MTNVKRIIVIIISCLEVAFSYAQEDKLKNSQGDTKISQTWQQFLSAITSNDNKAMFKELSDTAIGCYDCLENTTEEQNAMIQMRANDSTWYERIYEDMIYVPLADFIKDDFDLIFTPSFVKILKEKRPIFIMNDTNKDPYNEVLITTIEPSKEFEGMQYVFAFKEVNGILKFTQLSTIP